MFNTYFLFNLHLYNNFMLFDILPKLNVSKSMFKIGSYSNFQIISK